MSDADREMREHFDRRAPSYDDWWTGEGKFAAKDRPGWSAEVEELVGVVAGLPPGRILDVACGTGFLTRHLRGDVTGLDRSGPMLEIAAERMPEARLEQGDAVPLPFGEGEFDLVFTSHFLHHLEPDGRAEFLAEARRVGRELVVVEGVRSPDEAPEQWHEQAGADGAIHRHYRRAYTAEELAEELGGGQVLHAGRWFAVVASS